MLLKAHVWGAEPWYIEDPDHLSCTLDEAIAEAADQTASDAGSELLESPEQWCRDEFKRMMVATMGSALRDVGDSYKAPDGVLYTLEDSP